MCFQKKRRLLHRDDGGGTQDWLSGPLGTQHFHFRGKKENSSLQKTEVEFSLNRCCFRDLLLCNFWSKIIVILLCSLLLSSLSVIIYHLLLQTPPLAFVQEVRRRQTPAGRI